MVVETDRARPRDELVFSAGRLSADELTASAFSHIQEALNREPGVAIQRGNGREHLTAIRSPVFTGGAGAGSFLYLEDGVPLRAAGFANINGLFESLPELAGGIEVVRGPGGPLYGSNAIHGVVDLRTPEPAADFGVFGEIFGGTFDRVRARARVEGALGRHRLSAGGVLFSEDDFREESGVDEQKAQFDHLYEARGGVTVRSIASFSNLNQETAGFIEGPEAYRFRELTRENPTPQAFRDARAARMQSAVSWGGAGAWSFDVTAFGRWNDQDFILFFLPSQALEDSGHWSAGVQARARWRPRGDLDVLFGVDVDRTRGFLTEFQDLPTIFSFTQGLHYDYVVRSLQTAAYGLTEWEARPGLRLTAGLRVERVGYDYDTAVTGDVGRFRRPEDRRDAFLSPTARLGASWDVHERVSLRAQWTRAARAPQTSDLYRIQTTQTPGEIDRERIDAGEVGVNVRLPFGGLFDVAGYWMVKRDFIFRDADGFNVDNATTRHRGVEMDLAQPVGRHFTAEATFSYALHQYRFSRPGPSASSTITFGDDIDTAPRTVATVRGVWEPTSDLRFDVGLSHIGPYATDPGNTNRYPGHELVDVNAAWTPAGGPWRLFAGVRNAFNRDYAARADFAFGEERFFPGRGLSALAGVSFDY